MKADDLLALLDALDGTGVWLDGGGDAARPRAMTHGVWFDNTDERPRFVTPARGAEAWDGVHWR